ncbi:MAG: GGDEF domain-containing protein, partial [Hungatella sp.]
ARLVGESLSDLQKGEHGALLTIDVDHFKEVNDTYGHIQGDRALCAIANLLRSNFREEDIVGRPGGDEFMVYMKNINGIDILSEKCDTICKKIQNMPAEGYGQLTISLGAALCTRGISYEAAYRSADRALYQAKKAGKNRFKLVDATPGTH